MDVCSADDLESALRAAGEHARAGRFALLRVPVPDDDVPVGILRVMTSDDPAVTELPRE